MVQFALKNCYCAQSEAPHDSVGRTSTESRPNLDRISPSRAVKTVRQTFVAMRKRVHWSRCTVDRANPGFSSLFVWGVVPRTRPEAGQRSTQHYSATSSEFSPVALTRATGPLLALPLLLLVLSQIPMLRYGWAKSHPRWRGRWLHRRFSFRNTLFLASKSGSRRLWTIDSEKDGHLHFCTNYIVRTIRAGVK